MKWIKKRGYIFAASRVKDNILVSFKELIGTNVFRTCFDAADISLCRRIRSISLYFGVKIVTVVAMFST